jgi:hypothetical protein
MEEEGPRMTYFIYIDILIYTIINNDIHTYKYMLIYLHFSLIFNE